jgi:hypothetical protein
MGSRGDDVRRVMEVEAAWCRATMVKASGDDGRGSDGGARRMRGVCLFPQSQLPQRPVRVLSARRAEFM